ncbi:unnamed protein product [marine sediment metagenome]|uniref:Uncharacterized protein n=1 Tax=marine sediment metagenome TaxID=412755 RepID=X1TCD0_9ZZZZ
MESIQVGDVKGHFVGMYEIKGLSSHKNGEVATYMDWGTFDSIEGFKGYFVLTFEDGSTQWAKYQGTSKPAQGGKITLYEGTWKYIKGTDRFAGIEGSGSFTGKNFTPPDVVYIDYAGTYTLPRPGTAALAPGNSWQAKSRTWSASGRRGLGDEWPTCNSRWTGY